MGQFQFILNRDWISLNSTNTPENNNSFFRSIEPSHPILLQLTRAYEGTRSYEALLGFLRAFSYEIIGGLKIEQNYFPVVSWQRQTDLQTGFAVTSSSKLISPVTKTLGHYVFNPDWELNERSTHIQKVGSVYSTSIFSATDLARLPKPE